MTQVKICGITNEDDMLAAIEAGANMLGFIFYEKSPRYVTAEQVASFREIARGLDAPRIPLFVGVFVDPTPEYLGEMLLRANLPAAQIHRATGDKLRRLRHVSGASDYPAIQPRTLEDGLAAVEALRAAGLLGLLPWQPDLLVDAYHPDLAGGTGQRADLEMARQIGACAERMMLAGGLTPDNVAATIRAVRPWAVDVSSGVEAAPGRKDHEKVRAFIKAVRDEDSNA